jgi:hypothetical protein
MEQLIADLQRQPIQCCPGNAFFPARIHSCR